MLIARLDFRHYSSIPSLVFVSCTLPVILGVIFLHCGYFDRLLQTEKTLSSDFGGIALICSQADHLAAVFISCSHSPWLV